MSSTVRCYDCNEYIKGKRNLIEITVLLAIN